MALNNLSQSDLDEVSFIRNTILQIMQKEVKSKGTNALLGILTVAVAGLRQSKSGKTPDWYTECIMAHLMVAMSLEYSEEKRDDFDV